MLICTTNILMPHNPFSTITLTRSSLWSSVPQFSIQLLLVLNEQIHDSDGHSAFRSVSCCFYTLSLSSPNSSTLISSNSSLKFINSLISSVPSLFLNVSLPFCLDQDGFPLRSLPPFQWLVWKLIFLMSCNSLQPVSLILQKPQLLWSLWQCPVPPLHAPSATGSQSHCPATTLRNSITMVIQQPIIQHQRSFFQWPTTLFASITPFLSSLPSVPNLDFMVYSSNYPLEGPFILFYRSCLIKLQSWLNPTVLLPPGTLKREIHTVMLTEWLQNYNHRCQIGTWYCQMMQLCFHSKLTFPLSERSILCLVLSPEIFNISLELMTRSHM